MNDLAISTGLQEKIVEKIRASFVEFIPDVEWDNLVRTEVTRYIKDKLKPLIQEELTNLFRAEIKKELENPKFWADGWGEHGELPGEAVKEIIKELVPDMMSAMFGNIVQQITMQIRGNLTQNMY